MPRTMTHIETPLNAPMRHLVIGHSQVRHVWQHVPENADNSVCIDWISVSGNRFHELVKMIKNEINDSAIPLYT